VNLDLRPPSPEEEKVKIQVLHLVSLRNRKTSLSLPQLYLSCTELSARDGLPLAPQVRMVAGACNAPKPPDLPFRYRLPVKRRIPLILPPNPTGGFEPPALGL
jgi:hypothetical protein